MNKSVNILSRANSKKDKYNILTFDTHERYQSQMAKTGHNFYSFRFENNGQGQKTWDLAYSKIPDNYYILPKNSIYAGLDFDMILAQSRFGQIQLAANLKNMLGLPVILLEHTLPIDSWPSDYMKLMKSLSGDINVFISDYSKGRWGFNNGLTVRHSVDSDIFCPDENIEKESYILSVVNDFINRDYCCNFSGWKRITEGLPVRLVGNTPGLSKAASSVPELVNEYRKAKVFLNTSTVSPVPMSLIEAMSCGCAVVSTATCMIPEIITNGVNGFISNNEEELRDYTKLLLKDGDLAKKLGSKARETILTRFSMDDFINTWNSVFDLTYNLKGRI